MSKKQITYAFIDSQNLNLGVRIDLLQSSLKYQKSQHRRSVETLGLSGNGDARSVAKQGQNVNKGQ